ncbi:L-serine ammonia-lyase, iron-sulfur-dependent, subunit alpha [Clostridium aestuarii]|uniref:UPF0597 protein OW763_11485 n=1 Tax=Clostridium aestuarii TaxID=338193 RepID=A0ABT4D142_9CLOT|nr:L-serine ammonia-lyase, iron-sulfur-dependent, subunit alpha [Clostridium aestuarii]MCY6484965.1 L-serine ammonia-lyase, iron-sulfur-dependent, subunit alpha [Clostridium aestuarii]
MKENKQMEKALLEIVKRETKPAIGCTEPVAVAFTAATAKKYLKGEIKKINVKVSNNIFKNGKSVIIPNTEECGMSMSAALGVLCGDAEEGLFVFKNVTPKYVEDAKNMLKDSMVTVTTVSNSEDVFVEIDIEGEDNQVSVVLSGGHTHIQKIKVNEEIVFEENVKKTAKDSSEILKKMTFKQIREIAETIDIKELDFVIDGVKMNRNAAEEGLKKEKGVRWGASLLKLQKKGVIGNDVSIKARILTAAGCDLRMSGGNCPIMTSGGSGNQGLGVVIPISVMAEEIEAPIERLQRAIFFGHAINNFVKKYTGKLSAICGCAIAAGIGASAAIAWLLGGNDKQIEGAVQNMLANLTGMVCDGAKESCALKLSTSSAESIIAAAIACDDVIVPNKTGILGQTVEETIKNLGTLCREGFYKADEVMTSIISV